ncbi:sulfotransferase [Oleiphilus messinensis]|uniref:Sulfotransferase n=1 Tax=Oleiphilus messinensis TaxID=141451 RepID=A0A1Y0I4W4_9GAMM|nr:sulfotransferase domain-containing protein [Oleiphilus messinensis]ARU55249.1 sulfotransferase [Oleiphilus messinensis]
MTEGNLVWLASYPKSGNTWFRLFMAALTHGKTEIDLESISKTEIASSREWFLKDSGLDSTALTLQQINRIRPDIYRHHAKSQQSLSFHKVHDAYIYNDVGAPLFPPEISARVLYLIRNPLDVCVSFAHHAGHDDYDKMLLNMMDPEYAMAKTTYRPADQLQQQLRSWSQHVDSWELDSGIACLVIRYEDMKSDALAAFTRAARFLGLPSDAERIKQAIDACAFQKLKKQELEKGFKERPKKSKSFFREGEVGTWRQKLDKALVEKFILSSRETLLRHGYIDENNQPVF